MTQMAHTRSAIGFLLAVVSTVALAWESGEFKSGAPQDRVLQRFRSQGFKIQQLSPTSYMADRGHDTFNVGFCNGRLTFHSASVRGGIRGFIRRVSQLSNRYGQGELGTLNSETNSGEVNMLSVTWQLGVDTLRITYVARTENVAESQEVAWFARSECQDQLR